MEIVDSKTISIFEIDLDSSQQDHWVDQLSQEEKTRSNRFVTETLRIRWSRCRGALRGILGGILGERARELVFEEDGNGKPFLASHRNDPTRDLQFSVSHSQGRAIIAVAHATLVGADIEIPGRALRVESLESQLFTEDERIQWRDIPTENRLSIFLDTWVCKEAILKGIGIGIALGLKRVGLPSLPLPELPFSPVWLDVGVMKEVDSRTLDHPEFTLQASAWNIHRLTPRWGIASALAYPGTLRQLKFRALEDFK